VTRERLWLRVLSVSYVTALPPELQAELRTRVLRHIDQSVPEFAADKTLDATATYPYRTDAFWTFAHSERPQTA